MKSCYYYGYCYYYYESLPDPLRKWYKTYASDLIVLYNNYETEGAFYKLIELKAIKKKLNWKAFGKAL